MKKAVIDIDGVLNNYPQTELDFYNSEYSNGIKVNTLEELKNKLSYADYKKMKTAYRQSDYKHDAKTKTGSHELLEHLNSKNYLIYIITARELFKYNQLEKTITWLKKNKLKYDYIYCTQKKDFTIFEKFGHIDLLVEDNYDNIKKIQMINGNNAKYYMVRNSDNSHTKDDSIKIVNDLDEVLFDVVTNELFEDSDDD